MNQIERKKVLTQGLTALLGTRADEMSLRQRQRGLITQIGRALRPFGVRVVYKTPMDPQALLPCRYPQACERKLPGRGFESAAHRGRHESATHHMADGRLSRRKGRRRAA
jgi:hypothetical protein